MNTSKHNTMFNMHVTNVPAMLFHYDAHLMDYILLMSFYNPLSFSFSMSVIKWSCSWLSIGLFTSSFSCFINVDPLVHPLVLELITLTHPSSSLVEILQIQSMQQSLESWMVHTCDRSRSLPGHQNSHSKMLRKYWWPVTVTHPGFLTRCSSSMIIFLNTIFYLLSFVQQ